MNYEEIEVETSNGAKTFIVVDLGDGNYKSFPAEPANPEYAAFLAALEALAE